MIAGTAVLPAAGAWPAPVDLPAPTAPALRPFTLASGDAFTGLLIQGVPPVRRTDLAALLDALYPQIALDVSSKLFNASTSDIQDLAVLPIGSALSDRVAYRSASIPVTTSSVATLAGVGLEFLPDPAGFLFKNANPTQWRILISGLREGGPALAYKARSQYVNQMPTVTTWTYLESEVQYGSFFAKSAGYPTALKIAAVSWRYWQDSVPWNVVNNGGNPAPDPTNTLWPGFTTDAWESQNPDGTYLNTPTALPVASGNALSDVLDRTPANLRVNLPANLTAYFLAVQ